MEQTLILTSELKSGAKSISSFLFQRKSDHPIHRSLIEWDYSIWDRISSYRKVKTVNDLRQEIRRALKNIDVREFIGAVLRRGYSVEKKTKVNLLLMNIVDFNSTHMYLHKHHFVILLFQ